MTDRPPGELPAKRWDPVARMVDRGYSDPDAALGDVLRRGAELAASCLNPRAARHVHRELETVLLPRWSPYRAGHLTSGNLADWYASICRRGDRTVSRLGMLAVHAVVGTAWAADGVLAATGGAQARAMVAWAIPVRNVARQPVMPGNDPGFGVADSLARVGSVHGQPDSLAAAAVGRVQATGIWVTDRDLVFTGLYGDDVSWSAPLAEVASLRARPRLQVLNRARVRFADSSRFDLFTRPRRAIRVLGAAAG